MVPDGQRFIHLVKATLFFTFIALNAFGQTNSKVGMKSPELLFSKILNFETSSAKLSDLKSKVVLIDFWATWCTPCIASFPHLEELQEEFGAYLQVITVTEEPEERITKFLTSKSVNLPIAIDKERELAAHFPHRTIPHAVLIDQEGIIRAITTPSEINKEAIKKVISNEQINLYEKRDVMDFDPSMPLSRNENFMYQITVTPFQEGLPSMSNEYKGKGKYGNRRILAVNLSARSLYELAYQFPASLKTVVEVNDESSIGWSKNNAICLDLIVPEDKGDQRFDILKQQLDMVFDLTTGIEERMRAVKILKVIDGESAGLLLSTDEESTSSWSGSGLSMKNEKTAVIASFLENQFYVPVIDETGLKGLYDLELEWRNEEPDQIYADLKKWRLELVDDDRKIEVLVISDKE